MYLNISIWFWNWEFDKIFAYVLHNIRNIKWVRRHIRTLSWMKHIICIRTTLIWFYYSFFNNYINYLPCINRQWQMGRTWNLPEISLFGSFAGCNCHLIGTITPPECLYTIIPIIVLLLTSYNHQTTVYRVLTGQQLSTKSVPIIHCWGEKPGRKAANITKGLIIF